MLDISLLGWIFCGTLKILSGMHYETGQAGRLERMMGFQGHMICSAVSMDNTGLKVLL
jgi:hypothetical protein